MKRAAIALATLVGLLARPAFAAEAALSALTASDHLQVSTAAKAALLNLLPSLVDSANLRSLGFESAKDLQRAKLADPLPEVIVRLDRLATGTPASTPRSFVDPSPLVIVPILVDLDGPGPNPPFPRTGIGLTKTSTGWQPVSFGDANLVRAVERERTRLIARGIPASATCLVSVPSFNLSFLGFSVNGTTMLVALFEDKAFGFKTGEEHRATDVFQILKPASQTHNGKPS